MILMKLTPILASGALVLGLSACAAGPSTTSDGVKIIAAFYPLEWTAKQVAGKHGTVETLTAPGAEAHDLELTPQQIASLSTADLVLYVKGFQPAVDEAIKQSGATALNVGDVVTLHPASEAEHDHEHEEASESPSATASASDSHDEHDHAESASPSASPSGSETSTEDAEEHEHDHGDFDPHFWQDPTLVSTLSEALGKRLGEIDSAHASDFTSAAQATSKELATLDEEYKTGLKTCKRREFITTHAAFNYLAQRYKLEEIGISGVNPDTEPSPARIAEVHEEAKAHGVTTIFFETLTSDAVAKAIAGDLNLETAVLDPLEGVTEKSPGTDYPSIMRANLAALEKANECTS